MRKDGIQTRKRKPKSNSAAAAAAAAVAAAAVANHTNQTGGVSLDHQHPGGLGGPANLGHHNGSSSSNHLIGSIGSIKLDRVQSDLHQKQSDRGKIFFNVHFLDLRTEVR